MKTLITICARGGSKGIPGKNIKTLNNKPLIYYTVKVANRYAELYPGTQVYLSTDSSDIKSAVRELSFRSVNLEYNRPAELATDSAGKMPVLKDVLEFAQQKQNVQFDYVIDLDVTSPLRTIRDIESAHRILQEDPEALNIFSVNPANRNPYFNMVEKQEGSKYIRLCKEGKFLTRQSAPKVYDMNASFYIFRRKFFEMGLISPITDRSLVYEMPHLCFDLDHTIDYEFMSFLIEKGKLDFELLS